MKLTKIIMAVCIIALTAGTTMAQSGRLSIGLEVAQPLGDFGDAGGTGFGGSLRYEFPMGDKLGLTLTAGYITFGGKDQEFGGQTFEGPSISIIPVQAGLKFYFKEQQAGLYIMGEIGMHSVSTGDVDGFEGSSNTGISYAPAIGFHMAKIDIGLRYQFFSQETSFDDGAGNIISESSTEGYIGLRVAFVFGGE
ncbi:MAG: outer membrane beta-barrel protein [Bacteroidia bacterium]